MKKKLIEKKNDGRERDLYPDAWPDSSDFFIQTTAENGDTILQDVLILDPADFTEEGEEEAISNGIQLVVVREDLYDGIMAARRERNRAK